MENWNEAVKSGRLESENEAMERLKGKLNITGTQSDQKNINRKKLDNCEK